MKCLLIIGACGHGKVVAEVAEEIGYEQIAFIDDNNLVAIGKVSELEKYKNQYSDAFVGIGNSELRGKLIDKLQDCGYTVPILVHPRAFVSRTAKIDTGLVIEPRVIVNVNSHISTDCMISVGTIVDHDVEIDDCCHVNAGAIVKSGGKVKSYRKLEGSVK